MTFGEAGKDGARVHDIKDVEAILEAFRAHGHTEVLLHRRLLTLLVEKEMSRRSIAQEPTLVAPVKSIWASLTWSQRGSK